MKNIVITMAVVLFLAMLCIPALSIQPDSLPKPESSSKISSQPGVVSTADYFRVLDTSTDKVMKIDEDEYVWGVVAAEMSYTYSTEALKAQAVAAYTLAVRARNIAAGSKAEYDLTNDPTKHQSYITKEKAKEKWNSKYEEGSKKITEAVEAVSGLAVTYKDEPIFAAYHCISGGKTESAKVVWGSDYAYLQPIESIGDLLADGYLTTVSYTPDAFIERAKALELTLSGDAGKFVTQPTRSDSGTVTKYTLGGKSFTGAQMRSAFGLRSANFDLVYKDKELVFTVRGYGHGVGMSQQGAEYMAQQGSKYDEILNWYYKDCKIQKYADLAKKK